MDHRLRVRQRFSGFYDVDVREDAPASDIDGANFDAQGYVSSMLATRQLPELVAKSNELSGEIKVLHFPPPKPSRTTNSSFSLPLIFAGANRPLRGPMHSSLPPLAGAWYVYLD